MTGHPKHPPCPECSKALYKKPPWEVDYPVITKTPWAFCRNKACTLHVVDQVPGRRPGQKSGEGEPVVEATSTKPAKKTKKKKKTKKTKKVEKKVEKKKAGKVEKGGKKKKKKKKKTKKSETLRGAKERIEQALKDNGPWTKKIVLHAITTVYKSLGWEVANQLIEDYSLAEKVDIEPFVDEDDDEDDEDDENDVDED